MKDLALLDPRFKSKTIPTMKKQIKDYKDLETEVDGLRIRIARCQSLELLEKMVSIKCPRDFKNLTIIKCQSTRKNYSCRCEALKKWIEKYILDD